ncbi:UNVERIFIED_CONTAM: hypothetical protein K2H54_040264, partial [Gekko kuhli]
IVFSTGENWKVMRRFAITTLKDYGMGKKTIEDRIVEECRFLIQKFESFEGEAFETSTIMNGATANIIVSILLGKRYEYEDPTFIRLLNLVNENARLVGSPSVMLYNMFPALGFLSGGRKTFLKNRKELHAFIQATFIEHLKELDVNDQRSLIDAFLIQQQEEKNKNQSNDFFHNENLKAVVVDLFGAGMETTSTTLRWGLLLMMKYPEIQKKVQEEMTKVIGSAQPRIEHRAKLPYTDAVVHEVQRFANIIPTNMPHATSADVTLGDYFIPKGTRIIPLLYSVLYDESEWEKPLKFYPEHFLDSEGKFVKRDAFLPFSAGRRVCAGETLARMELFLFFASLLQRFTFQPAPGMSREDLDLTPADISDSAELDGVTNFHVPYTYLRNTYKLGPRPLPLIGNLHLMDVKRPYKTMLKLSKQYGPVFSIRMGGQKMVVLTGYKTVKEALVNQADAFMDRPKVSLSDQRYGIVTSNGENWKVMRRFAITTLRDYGMGKKTIEDKIAEECQCLIQKFESFEGKPFETTIIMNAAVANIIVSILLGKRYEYEDPTFIRLLNLFNENIRLVGSPSLTLSNMFPALSFLSGGRRTVINNRDEVFAFIQATFIEHLKELDVNDQRSFVDAFLIQQQEEKNKNQSNEFFHNENLKAVVANLFGAGMETTSTTLRWSLLLMMKYPEIQKKVQEEMTKVIGSAQPRIEHRAKLPYTDAVVHEVQRFANIIPTNLPHATTADVTLGDYFIPKGTHIVPLLYSVLYDESEWEKPLKFYPEHFLDSEGKFVKRDAFLPFSAGRRVCAGETLARMELFLFFASLLQRFTFQPAPGMSKEDLDLTPAVGFTTPPMPYSFCALPRS